MKRVTLSVVLVMLFGAAALADDATWKKYSNAEGGYTVSLPKTPAEQTREVKTEIGVVVIRMAVAELSANTVYMVSVNDYPAAAAKTPADALLNGGVKGGVGDGQLISSKNITYKDTKIPGREVIFTKQGFHCRLRIYLSGVRLYQVLALDKEDNSTSKEVESFLESFEITPAK